MPQRPTLDYAGPAPNLPPPLEHEGMKLPRTPRRHLIFFFQAVGGLFYAAFFVLVLGWWATELFPNPSEGCLKMALIPLLGMPVVAAVAIRLSRSPSMRGWSLGLWVGGLFSLALYAFYMIGIGYFHWFVVG